MTSATDRVRQPGMTNRLCTRPGCGMPAAATLRFQPTDREAWLYDIDASGVRTEGDLCERHAGTLVLPRGWVFHDQRGTGLAAERIGAWRRATPAAPAKTGAATGGTGRSTPSTGRAVSAAAFREAGTKSGEPQPAAAPAGRIGQGDRVIRPAVPAADAGATDHAAGPSPVEELAETLDARTPLLRRAFQNVTPVPDEG